MIISLSWLRDYVTVDMPVDELAHMLTMAGLEVDAVEDRYHYLDKVVVGRIAEIEPHPNADKLRICKVQTDQRTYQIVCGAPNAAIGMTAPLALPGCELPSEMVVVEGVIRGQSSEGMLCSEAELGLGPDGSGLMVLSDDLAPGHFLNKALELSDHVLEIGLTPNRSDCLSFFGVAREIAGFQGASIKKADIKMPVAHDNIENLTSVIIESPDHCPRYAARLVTDIKVGPSPFWLQDRLLSVGLRPINNIVDITNYVMMETGQPLHAFDFDNLVQNRIVVRTAAQDEPFTTLDGKERKLDADMLMICDGEKPVAVGGVMGGMNSEIEDGTTRVLIESAYFNPVSIRRTAKKLGLKTDASHRFERGVDPHGTQYALDRAAQLIAELGAGRLVEGCIDVQYDLPQNPTIDLSVAHTNRLLGTDFSCDEIAALLSAIEFNVQVNDETLRVDTPSFRVDVSRPEDLMEEVARRAGYDRIPVTFPVIPADAQPASKILVQRQDIRELLCGMGFAEVINYSFIHPESSGRLRLPETDPRSRQLAILNPLSEDQAVMRTSLIPGLLETMKRNLSRQSNSLKLFETGMTFISNGSDAQPDEIDMLAGLWTGDRSGVHWQTRPEPCDFYDLKGAVEGLLENLRLGTARFTHLDQDLCFYTQPGATAQIMVGDQPLGIIGQVHPMVLKAYELKQNAFIFEMDLKQLVDLVPDVIQSSPLPKYPSTARDATLIVDKKLETEDVLAYVRQMDEPLVEEVNLFDLFEGKPIAQGRKSISVRIVYRSSEATLEDAAVNQLHKQISDKLVAHFKADLPA